MLLYEDYFSCNTSPSSSLHHCSKLDAKIYDIIFLPPSHTQQNKKQQCTATIQWIDPKLVSQFRKKNRVFF
jgi:hypothetical protein